MEESTLQESTTRLLSKVDTYLPYLLLPLLAFGIILPLILRGCSCGHDFPFHLVSWFDVMQQFKHGNLFPHWAYSPAWNAGEPRFLFYPPISWTLGALLGLIHWPTAYLSYSWIAVTATGLAFHRLARQFSAPNPALLASALYMVNPYLLFTLYERAAYAELLSSAWICLLLLAVLRERPRVPGIAIAVALLWLTNAPAAVLGCYLLAFIALVRFIYGWIAMKSAPLAMMGTILNGTILGLAVAAVYIVPAAWQRQFVQIQYALPQGMLPQSNFLFGHTGEIFHDAILHVISLLASSILATGAVVFLALAFSSRMTSEQRPAPAFLIPTLALSAALILFLLLPPSAVIWSVVPQLQFLQFPWRLLVALAPIIGLALAVLLSRISLGTSLGIVRTVLIAMLLGFILVPVSIQKFRQFCDSEDTPEGVEHAISTRLGIVATDEYTPNGAHATALKQGAPAYWLTPDPNNVPDESNDDTSPPLPMDFLIESQQRQFLVLNLRDYPSWRIRVNGQLVPAVEHRHRDDGRITVPVISGVSTVNIAWGTTSDVTLGRVLSLLALLRLAFLLYRRRVAHVSLEPHLSLKQ